MPPEVPGVEMPFDPHTLPGNVCVHRFFTTVEKNDRIVATLERFGPYLKIALIKFLTALNA